MEMAAQALEVLGLLAILGSVAVAFVQLIKWMFGKQANKVKLGAQLLACFSVAYFAIAPALRFIDQSHYGEDAIAVSLLFWWLSLAFMVDAGVRKFIWQGLMAEHGVSHVPKLIRDLVSLLVYAVAVMVVMHFVYGEPIAAVLATSGGLAFVIGIAAQKTLAEAFAGLSLSLSRTLKVGDYLEVDGVYGQVHEMNWRSISLHNPHTDSLYIFPNSAVAGSTVLNYCTPESRFKDTLSFKVELHAPPELVMRSVLTELENSRSVFQEPKPDIHALEFNDYGVTYRIRYFFDGDEPWWDAKNEVVNAIWTAMKRNGFRFAVNRNHLMSGLEWDLPSRPNGPALSDDTVVGLLKTHALFEYVDDATLSAIVSNSVRGEWLPPECIYQQGDSADALVLVVEGICDIYLNDDMSEYKVGSAQRGDIMGIPDRQGAAMRYSQTLQPQQFCVAYKISYAMLFELLGEDRVVALFEAHFEKLAQQHIEQLQVAKQSESDRQHSQHHAKLLQSLKQQLSRYYNDGLAAHLWSSIFPHAHEVKVLDALAGSCALITAEDGELSEGEASYFCELVEHVGSLKHINHDEIVNDFNKYVVRAIDDFESTKGSVFKALEELSADDAANHLIMGACHAMAGLHGRQSERTVQLLNELAETLGSAGDVKEMLNHLDHQL